jgi:hypothetical protein
MVEIRIMNDNSQDRLLGNEKSSASDEKGENKQIDAQATGGK